MAIVIGACVTRACSCALQLCRPVYVTPAMAPASTLTTRISSKRLGQALALVLKPARTTSSGQIEDELVGSGQEELPGQSELFRGSSAIPASPHVMLHLGGVTANIVPSTTTARTPSAAPAGSRAASWAGDRPVMSYTSERASPHTWGERRPLSLSQSAARKLLDQPSTGGKPRGSYVRFSAQTPDPTSDACIGFNQNAFEGCPDAS